MRISVGTKARTLHKGQVLSSPRRRSDHYWR